MPGSHSLILSSSQVSRVSMSSESQHLPIHRNWASSYLTVQSPQRALSTYIDVFGFTKKEVLKDKYSDRILYAMVNYKNYDFMFGPDVVFGERTGSIAPVASMTPSPVTFYIYVENIDTIYEKVKQANLQIIAPLTDTFWGDRMFKTKCTEGYYWSFAEHIGNQNSTTKMPDNVYYEYRPNNDLQASDENS